MSNRKTPNIQLNDWVGEDKYVRRDFVEDNRIIDNLLGELSRKVDDYISGNNTKLDEYKHTLTEITNKLREIVPRLPEGVYQDTINDLRARLDEHADLIASCEVEVNENIPRAIADLQQDMKDFDASYKISDVEYKRDEAALYLHSRDTSKDVVKVPLKQQLTANDIAPDAVNPFIEAKLTEINNEENPDAKKMWSENELKANIDNRLENEHSYNPDDADDQNLISINQVKSIADNEIERLVTEVSYDSKAKDTDKGLISIGTVKAIASAKIDNKLTPTYIRDKLGSNAKQILTNLGLNSTLNELANNSVNVPARYINDWYTLGGQNSKVDPIISTKYNDHWTTGFDEYKTYKNGDGPYNNEELNNKGNMHIPLSYSTLNTIINNISVKDADRTAIKNDILDIVNPKITSKDDISGMINKEIDKLSDVYLKSNDLGGKLDELLPNKISTVDNDDSSNDNFVPSNRSGLISRDYLTLQINKAVNNAITANSVGEASETESGTITYPKVRELASNVTTIQNALKDVYVEDGSLKIKNNKDEVSVVELDNLHQAEINMYDVNPITDIAGVEYDKGIARHGLDSIAAGKYAMSIGDKNRVTTYTTTKGYGETGFDESESNRFLPSLADLGIIRIRDYRRNILKLSSEIIELDRYSGDYTNVARELEKLRRKMSEDAPRYKEALTKADGEFVRSFGVVGSVPNDDGSAIGIGFSNSTPYNGVTIGVRNNLGTPGVVIGNDNSVYRLSSKSAYGNIPGRYSKKWSAYSVSMGMSNTVKSSIVIGNRMHSTFSITLGDAHQVVYRGNSRIPHPLFSDRGPIRYGSSANILRDYTVSTYENSVSLITPYSIAYSDSALYPDRSETRFGSMLTMESNAHILSLRDTINYTNKYFEYKASNNPINEFIDSKYTEEDINLETNQFNPIIRPHGPSGIINLHYLHEGDYNTTNYYRNSILVRDTILIGDITATGHRGTIVIGKGAQASNYGLAIGGNASAINKENMAIGNNSVDMFVTKDTVNDLNTEDIRTKAALYTNRSYMKKTLDAFRWDRYIFESRNSKKYINPEKMRIRELSLGGLILVPGSGKVVHKEHLYSNTTDPTVKGFFVGEPINSSIDLRYSLTKITNVYPGTISADSFDVVVGHQLHELKEEVTEIAASSGSNFDNSENERQLADLTSKLAKANGTIDTLKETIASLETRLAEVER